ncbi:MAG TPA: acyltransferase [Polyangiaceae bacterium]|jgi:peptidoglycan/LPS O-acetylase OafA/YrhL|nr:acyltransferase [Polyangiaceae bacterium]
MRDKRLDVLRCVALLCVLVRHSFVQLRIATAGWVGVDLFFVLSGFLISGLLFGEYRRRGSISFKRFIVRRWFKLYPAFCVFLGATFCVESLTGRPSSTRQYLSEILYFQNYGKPIWNHTWSLAVEEHFYLLLPIFLLVLIRFSANRADPFRMVPGVFLLVAVICLAFRVVTVLRIPLADLPDWGAYRKVLIPTHERIDSLFFGVTLGYLHHFRPDILARALGPKNNRVIAAALSVLLLLPCLLLPPGNRFMLTAGLTMLYLGFGIILMLSLRSQVVVPARFVGVVSGLTSALAFVGVYSYSIYLWHGAVQPWGAEFLRRWFHVQVHGVPLVASYFLISVSLGIAMSRLVEYPCLRLRDHLFPEIQIRSDRPAQAEILVSTRLP